MADGFDVSLKRAGARDDVVTSTRILLASIVIAPWPAQPFHIRQPRNQLTDYFEQLHRKHSHVFDIRAVHGCLDFSNVVMI